MTEVPYVNGPMRRDILAYIADHPNCTSAAIAQHLGKGHYNISTALGILTKRGVVARHRDGNEFRYVLPEPFKAHKPRKAPALPDLFITADTSKLFEAEAQLELLAARIAELEAWKADAIAKHSDLAPVDPVLAKARLIASGIVRNLPGSGVQERADQIEEGLFDDNAVVRAALAALRSVEA